MFRLVFNAQQYEPIKEFTAEMRAEWFQTCFRNPSAEEVEAVRDAYAKYQERLRQEAALKAEKQRDAVHEHFVERAGAKPGFVMSVAQAKAYVRMRAANSLQAAFEFLEDVLIGKVSTTSKDRIDIANEIIKRAAGTATVMNAVPNVRALAELAPVDAIDTVMKAYASGDVDDKFVQTLLGLLGAKINGLRLEEAGAKKSAAKVSEKMQKPPSGKIV